MADCERRASIGLAVNVLANLLQDFGVVVVAVVDAVDVVVAVVVGVALFVVALVRDVAHAREVLQWEQRSVQAGNLVPYLVANL